MTKNTAGDVVEEKTRIAYSCDVHMEGIFGADSNCLHVEGLKRILEFNFLFNEHGERGSKQ